MVLSQFKALPEHMFIWYKIIINNQAWSLHHLCQDWPPLILKVILQFWWWKHILSLMWWKGMIGYCCPSTDVIFPSHQLLKALKRLTPSGEANDADTHHFFPDWLNVLSSSSMITSNCKNLGRLDLRGQELDFAHQPSSLSISQCTHLIAPTRIWVIIGW